MSSAKREDNREVALILQNTLGTNVVYPTGVALTNSTPMHVAIVDTSGTQVNAAGMNIPTYDYVAMVLSVGNTVETYTFKTGGSGGTTVATVAIVYTDNTRAVVSTVTRT